LGQLTHNFLAGGPRLSRLLRETRENSESNADECDFPAHWVFNSRPGAAGFDTPLNVLIQSDLPPNANLQIEKTF
jgi:hypothetical protein